LKVHTVSPGVARDDLSSVRSARNRRFPMKIRQILDKKGRGVVTISPGATVMDALQLLVANGIGSLVVLQGEEVVGILTERDILRLASRDPAKLRSESVESQMTQDLMVSLPSHDVQYVMEIMTRNRVRHLPVMDEGALAGIISIGDVVNAVRQEVEAENHRLRDYVQGVVR
jgi:CBS domain-containing protein